LPFDSETASAVLVAHVLKSPPKLADVAPRVPPALATVVDCCLAKDPGSRYQSGAEMARVLDEAAAVLARDPEHAVAEPAVLSQREAEALWARAAELQANTGLHTPPPVAAPSRTASSASDRTEDRRTLTSGYRMDDVRGAAVEAGIPERYVARAAAELGIAPAAPASDGSPVAADTVNRSPRPNPWAGASTMIILETQVPGEVPQSELDILVDIIRRRMGEAGHVGTLGRSVSWSSTTKDRRLQVSIVPRGGRTTIRIDERLAPLAGALFGGIMGGGGGGSGGLAMATGMTLFHSVGAALGIWGAMIVGCYGVARTIFSAKARRRERELREMLEELAAQALESIRLLPLLPPAR
ncbi:MAG TPA: hypothetical protein VJ867_07150, partial [Gemmatimonadaceae bacterium]|nr:hypothetical protein [Gemmatimonadaceae bacterium]